MTEHRLCSFAELAPSSAKRFDIEGHRIAVIRIADDVYAIGDLCSHADYSLSEGDVMADTFELECPKHGSAFSVKDGMPGSLPATTPVPVYNVRLENGDVVLTLSSEES